MIVLKNNKRYKKALVFNNNQRLAMKCNLRRTDKIVKVFIGLMAILIGFYFKNWWGAIGLIPSTCSEKKDKQS
ncbi:MAG: hypothetical protein COT43_08195 [Candidatus Marinimicrobia bacterium CG08_land_8_20_14_0_20_45_22]|nr:MAG: hypothetical protein COT43_08195 [Candidatus Marinimicrobia bacterium CG08_land_8_20_14_0_20_45_22]